MKGETEMHLTYDLKKLYMDAFAPQPGENVTFLNDYPRDESKAGQEVKHRKEMTEAWHKVMVELSEEIGFTVNPIVTLDLRDPTPAGFDADGYLQGKSVNLDKIMGDWGEKDIVIAITGPSITGVLLGKLQRQNFRFASAPGVTADFEGFRADYSKIPLRFEILTHKMARASSVEMFFRYEEDKFFCRFDLRGQRYQFNENGEAHRPGEFINLPSGCANIPPYAGTASGVMGDSRTEGMMPALIDNELVVYRIEKNRIVEIIGDGPQAKKERDHILDPVNPDMAVITKLGLGVNEEARCNGTHVGDEKTMGMHWGYGPKKHFPDTIWAEHPIFMDMDFVYPDGSREPVFRNNLYSWTLGEVF